MLKDFTKFISSLTEAKLIDITSKITKTKSSNITDKDFLLKIDDSGNLLDIYYNKKYNKEISLKWNNNAKHNIVSKIFKRTNCYSVEEFNELFTKVLDDLFNNHFNELDKNHDSYGLYLNNVRKISFIIVLKYDNLFHDDSKIFIVTVTPTTPHPKEKLINIDDSDF